MLKKQMEQEATELKEQLRLCKETRQLKDLQLAQAMNVLKGSNSSI
ncbi:MAG: hypothetical protein MJK12_00975 [Colwellia sp.]|nr:hypothetical protein [Colwellia sp.]